MNFHQLVATSEMLSRNNELIKPLLRKMYSEGVNALEIEELYVLREYLQHNSAVIGLLKQDVEEEQRYIEEKRKKRFWQK